VKSCIFFREFGWSLLMSSDDNNDYYSVQQSKWCPNVQHPNGDAEMSCTHFSNGCA